MKIKRVFGLVFLLLLILEISLVSANFACGYVNDAEDFSGVWQDVLVYYDENPSYKTSCKISSENKFCCDLEKVQEINWETGKLVFAEIYSPQENYIAGPVSGLTTEDSYFVLPEMTLTKVINFNQPIKKILINESEVLINLSLIESYNNLKYSVNNNSEIFVCENCSSQEFLVPIEKGPNKIKLIAYNQENKTISLIENVYYLDYFIIQDSFNCENCLMKGNKFYIPSNSEVNLNLEYFSSHNVFSVVNILVPIDWNVPEEYFPEDYSQSHKLIKWNLSENPKIFSLTSSETTFKRKDYFIYEIGSFFKQSKVTVFSLTRFFPFSSNKKPSESFYFKNSIKNKCSQTEPLILEFEEKPFDLIAIYPKKPLSNANAKLITKKSRFFRKNQISFNLITNIPSKDINTILFRFKSPKKENIEFYDSYNNIINLEVYDEDENYYYYEAYFNEKGNFKLKLS